MAELETVALVASWPELVVFMFRCASSESPRLKESSLILFAELCDYLHPHIVTLLLIGQDRILFSKHVWLLVSIL